MARAWVRVSAVAKSSACGISANVPQGLPAQIPALSSRGKQYSTCGPRPHSRSFRAQPRGVGPAARRAPAHAPRRLSLKGLVPSWLLPSAAAPALLSAALPSDGTRLPMLPVESIVGIDGAAAAPANDRAPAPSSGPSRLVRGEIVAAASASEIDSLIARLAATPALWRTSSTPSSASRRYL